MAVRKELNDKEIGSIINIAHAWFPRYVAIGKELFHNGNSDDWEGRSCAQFSMSRWSLQHNVSRHLRTTLVGGPGGNYGKRDRYKILAEEKGDRVLRYYHGNHPFFTSYASRRPELEWWGGGVIVVFDNVVTPYAFAVSGLTEEADADFALTVAEIAFPHDKRLQQHRLRVIAELQSKTYHAIRDRIMLEVINKRFPATV